MSFIGCGCFIVVVFGVVVGVGWFAGLVIFHFVLLSSGRAEGPEILEGKPRGGRTSPGCWRLTDQGVQGRGMTRLRTGELVARLMN